MTDKRSLIRTFALAITCTALVALLYTSDEPELPENYKATDENEPDAFVVNGSYLEFDETGNLALQLESHQGVHFPNADQSIVGTPSVKIYQENQVPWVVNASQGQYFQEDRKLILSGDVNITRSNSNDPPLRFSTEELTLYSDTQFITTDKPVKLEDRLGTTEATGMNAWVKERRVELLSKVRGTYAQDPTHAQEPKE
ncbi:hypothetical protein OLMES_1895 [Oleiphilus messinensis]|uniref:Lipopolysaccharide export system protein LptC n=1 Tax=Oleiphilus messinensis TaxID=141451 RepID=A0A1Y0I6Z8_9GAMM|nr:LPS export ABC transporter periplasmic protein LptC [Oleiphilus messinensis]ARU55969.1 hypothetical protein OLMES_1895 [Oleiphilus messinensis]